MPFLLLALPLSVGGSEAVAKYPCGKAAERKKSLASSLFLPNGGEATTKLSVNSARGREGKGGHCFTIAVVVAIAPLPFFFG